MLKKSCWFGALGLMVLVGCSEDGDTPWEGTTVDASFAQPGAGDGGQPAPQMTNDAGMSADSGGIVSGSVDSGLATGSSDGGAGMGSPQAEAGVSDAGTDAGGPAATDAGSDGGGMSSAPLPDYTKRGRYMVKRLLNQGMGTIANGDSALLPLTSSNDPSALTVFFPENAQAGERFPLLTFGNGTFCSPTFYDELINHVVSHGFVVVAANTSTVGTGEPMLKAVDWALAQQAQSSSPIYGKIDPEHVGAFGHSQGGAGTCNAGLDPRVDALVPLSGVPLNQEAATGTVSKLKAPVLFLNTADEASGSSLIEDSFNAATAPAAYAVTMMGNHDEYTDIMDDPGVPGLTSNDARQSRAAVTAWFDWHLKGMSQVRALFVGASCGFCAGSTLKTVKSKGF